VFDSLAAEVDELEVPVDGAALLVLLAIRDRFDAKIAIAAGEFDTARLWDADGAVSMTAWLRSRADHTARVAHRLATTARHLRRLPYTAAAWADGRLTSGQIDTIVANIGRHHDLYADHEHDLVDAFTDLDVAATTAAMQEWRRRADAIDDGPPPDEHDGKLHLANGLDGRGELHGTLAPDIHQTLKAALRVADSGDRDLTPAQRRAQALGEVCRQFLDLQRTHHGGRHRPHLNIVVRYEDLIADLEDARYLDGGPVATATITQLLCDSVLHRLVVAGRSAILDYGRATHTIPVDLYNALVARDERCRFPGCDRPAHWCDGHHLWHWAHGGPTELANLVLVCRRHHRKLHATGWHAKLLPDATLEVTHPDGTTEISEPPGPIHQQFW